MTSGKIVLIDKSGKSVNMSLGDCKIKSTESTAFLVEHASESLKQCRELENAMNQLEEQLQKSFFPLIVGKRPSRSKKNEKVDPKQIESPRRYRGFICLTLIL